MPSYSNVDLTRINSEGSASGEATGIMCYFKPVGQEYDSIRLESPYVPRDGLFQAARFDVSIDLSETDPHWDESQTDALSINPFEATVRDTGRAIRFELYDPHRDIGYMQWEVSPDNLFDVSIRTDEQYYARIELRYDHESTMEAFRAEPDTSDAEVNAKIDTVREQ